MKIASQRQLVKTTYSLYENNFVFVIEIVYIVFIFHDKCLYYKLKVKLFIQIYVHVLFSSA